MTPFERNEVAFHYALVRAGYDVTERCYFLNRQVERQDLKAAPYVPFGRPTAAIDDAAPQRYDANVVAGDEAVSLHLDDVDAHLVEVYVPRDAVADGDRIYVEDISTTGAPYPIFYAAFEEGDDVHVLLYSWGEDRGGHAHLPG